MLALHLNAIAVASVLGAANAGGILDLGFFQGSDLAVEGTETSTNNKRNCEQAVAKLFREAAVSSPITFAIHRNGETDSCGSTPLYLPTLQQSMAVFNEKCVDMDAFEFESMLTDYISKQLIEEESCGSTDNSTALPGFTGFCDMGPERTVRNIDFQKLVRVPSGDLPCRFYTREGLHVTSLDQLIRLPSTATSESTAEECSSSSDEGECSAVPEERSSVHLYAVPAGRVFMFAPSYVGEVFELEHVVPPTGSNGSIALTVLSMAPRIFEISNFFTEAESQELIRKALGDTSSTYGFHRSTTGATSASVFNRRTSENAWDTHGKTSRNIKKRCFKLLGFDDFHEEYADGLQVLRYNETKAYIDHMDYLERNGKDVHDYDSAKKGSNRFATILLYMSDMGENDGGETMFPSAMPPGVGEEARLSKSDAVSKLREAGDAPMLEEGSWEEEMTAICRNRLSVRPSNARAVLFYSQYPNGVPDPSSKHGSCPVLRGTKLAANLWTWSGIRPEFPGAPKTRELTAEEQAEKKAKHTGPVQLQASFRNTGQDARFDETTELYFDEDGFFGQLVPNGPPIHVNTYETHRWNVRVNGNVLKSFVIGKDAVQNFEV